MPSIGGWRTIVIHQPVNLSLKDNCVAISNGTDEYCIPLFQIKNFLLANPAGTISVPLLLALAENNIDVVLCEAHRLPSARLLPLNCHNAVSGRLMDQCAWRSEKKAALWREIVCLKIQKQIDLLTRLAIEVPDCLRRSMDDVLPGDVTNREGLAARIYFSALFGSHFIRGTTDNTNAALNYGYTIIGSAMARIVSAYGYHGELGIHHCNRTNAYNLPCDLIEPFRPVVDELVFANQSRELDWSYKKELISLLQIAYSFDELETTLQTAMEQYALQCMKKLNSQDCSGGIISSIENVS